MSPRSRPGITTFKQGWHNNPKLVVTSAATAYAMLSVTTSLETEGLFFKPHFTSKMDFGTNAPCECNVVYQIACAALAEFTPTTKPTVVIVRDPLAMANNVVFGKCKPLEGLHV